MSKIKYVVLIFTILLIYTTTLATEYDVPKKPASVDVADIYLDGNLDIVLGNKTGCEYDNPTIYIKKNERKSFRLS